MIEIRVIGTPAPQGSKDYVGRGRMVESCKNLRPWREAVKYAAVEVEGRISGAVGVDVVFTLRKPKSAPKRRRTWPSTRPDVDKCARAVLDSLTQAGKIDDDASVVSLHATKVYPDEGTDALSVPGAVIRIMSVENGEVPGMSLS